MVFEKHASRKRFGQHWLKDPSVLRNIVQAAQLTSNDRVLEIGPGKGALTERLLSSAANSVHAIEIDRDLVGGLRNRFANQPRFTLIEGDVLNTPLNLPGGNKATKVVANIPYNITGPLLERLMGRLDRPAQEPFKLLVLLLQKEVAERIIASPGASSFSALSVRLQLMARCRRVCSVPPSCFQPPPKVQSEVISIEPFGSTKFLDVVLATRVEKLLKKAFVSRRKMLRNTLKGMCSPEELEDIANRAGIGLQQRPQEIPPGAWLELAKGLNQQVQLTKGL